MAAGCVHKGQRNPTYMAHLCKILLHKRCTCVVKHSQHFVQCIHYKEREYLIYLARAEGVGVGKGACAHSRCLQSQSVLSLWCKATSRFEVLCLQWIVGDMYYQIAWKSMPRKLTICKVVHIDGLTYSKLGVA